MRPAFRQRKEEAYAFSDWTTPRRRGAIPSFLLSAALHSTLVWIVWQVNPHPAIREFRAPTIEMILAEEDRKIVWYAPKAELPAVSPVEPNTATPDADAPRYKLPQRITANAPDPQSDKQMIVSDAPEISIEQDLDLPNMLSWKAPEVERPRFQPTEPKLVLPADLSIRREAAPEVETSSASALAQQKFEELARIRYRAQQQRAAAEAKRQELLADDAPEIASAPTTLASLDAVRFEELARLRYRGGANATRPTPNAPPTTLSAGQAPTISATRATQPGIAVGEMRGLSRLRYRSGGGSPQTESAPTPVLGADQAAPQVGATAGGSSGAAAIGADFAELSRLRYRAASGGTNGAAVNGAATPSLGGGSAPTVSRGRGSAGRSTGNLAAVTLARPGAPPAGLGAPGGDQSGGTGGDRNLVVAGVNPSNRLPDAFPRGSRRGRFSAGPDGGKGGDSRGAGGEQTAGLRVPNLSIEGPRRVGRSSLPGGAGASADDDIRRLFGSRSVSDAIPPSNLKIEFDPRRINIDNPFNGRPVYKTAINMPNVTSFRGDWIIQFAELEEDPEDGPSEGLADRAQERPEGITPPYPLKKVDPKYLADAMREQIQGEVVLYGVIRESGEITNLTLVKSVDDMLDKSAQDALAQWIFEPARKDGVAVAVEALVRIPFRLDPSIKMRY